MVTGAPFLSVTIASTTRTGGRSRAMGGPEGSSGAAAGARLAPEDAQPARATRRMTGQAARASDRQRWSMMGYSSADRLPATAVDLRLLFQPEALALEVQPLSREAEQACGVFDAAAALGEARI